MKISFGLVCLFGLVLQALAQQQIFCVVNTGSCLRIRTEASIAGQSLICVRDGTKLEDLNAQITAGGIIWRNVKYQSYTGWTSKQYLKSCGTVPSTPLPDVDAARPLTLLPLPTQRQVRQFYGDTRIARTNTAQFRSSQGMNPWLEFIADENDVVIASCGGQVVHAGDNSPFGAARSVIVRCDAWYVIYGRLKSTSVQRGDRLYLGQIVGRAGKEGLPLQVRPVPTPLLRDYNINNHPGDTTLAVNPLTVFSAEWTSYFNTEFNRLGGRQHFCTGDLTDLETTIKVLQDLGQPIPVELLAALRQLDEDIEGSGDRFQMSDALTGKVQTPADESAKAESEAEAEPMGTWSQQKYVDSSPYGQLTRDVNEEMASRPHYKVFVPQVFGLDECKPFYNIEAQVAQDDATAKPIGIYRLNTCDAMPKLKVAKEWAEKVDVRSPTAHREWLATDSACGSKESKAKLNRLLKELIQLEVSVTFYFAMCHPSNKKRTKVIQDGFMVALMLPDAVRKSVQDIVMTKMRSQLKNLYAIYKQDSLRMWGDPRLGELAARRGDIGDPANKVAPHEDSSGDDESSAEEEDLDKPPGMSCVFTPYGPNFLQGGPKHK